MKLEVINNINYSAQVVEIKNIIPIEKADQIVSTIILGNNVIVSKDTQIGDKGIFFPVEAKLSPEFIRNNNLYRDNTLNVDPEKKGFFELNGRIRCIKLRGTKSEGFFMPLSCLSFLDINVEELEIDTMFDTINDIQICEKYIIPARQQSLGGRKKQGKKAKVSRIVPGQFFFHLDTEQLGRNIHKFELDEEIDITVKVHGTSAISSYIMCNKKLTWFDKLLLKIGIRLQTTYYDHIYSSRKVIKNDDINKTQHFYSEDVWKKGHDKLQEFLEKGMTIYYEIVGYLGDNSYIQKGYDYGCVPGEFTIYVYRITHTNVDGKVYEFTPDQLQMWCRGRGLKAVIPVYRGTVQDLMHDVRHYIYNEHWRDDFLEILRNEFDGGIEKDCPYCNNKVPFEGYVIRKVNTMDFEAYKLKSFLFLKKETEQLDKGEENIEDNQGE